MAMSDRVQAFLDRLVTWRSTRRERPSAALHMFVQDVHTLVLPYAGRRGRAVTGTIEGDIGHIAQAKRTLGSLKGGYSRHDTTEIICAAVRETVQHLVWRGYAAFEIMPPTNEEEPGGLRVPGVRAVPAETFRPLRPLAYGWVLRSPLGLVELVASPEHWHQPRRLWCFYPNQRLWLVDPPHSLGGRWALWLTRKRLGDLPSLFPEWSTDVLTGDEQTAIRFDVNAYARARAANTASVARRWGWGGRDASTTFQTEFFAVHQTMAFHHSLALLREHVVGRLNHLLRKGLALDVQIKLSGLPSSAEIAAARAEMQSGAISLMDALERAGAV